MVVGGRELIDTLWNVNLFEISSSSLHIIELIDTLWNVNELMGWEENATVEELIDTLWNVNDCNKNMVLCFLSRINRYIMECKFTLGNG